jgi:hypothetical protein
MELNERDWDVNQTILSGDIGTSGTAADNSYHVVTCGGAVETAVLDGFTIAGGRADGVDEDHKGGGIYNAGGSPTLANLVVSGNYSSYGGGIYNDGGSPALIDVVISNNSVHYTCCGGGMYNTGGSSPVLTNVIISNNWAEKGAGMYNSNSNVTLVNGVLFYNRTWSYLPSTNHGGGIYSTNSSVMLVNVSFSLNSAGLGSSLFSGSGANYTLNNAIFWGNGPNSFYKTGGGATISYSLIQEGIPEWCIDGGYNVDGDPLFVDGPGGDLRLSSVESPAFNAGNNNAPHLTATDLDGNSRIFAGTVDMGAYEFSTVGWTTAAPSPAVFAGVPGNQTTCSSLQVINSGGATCTIDEILGCDTAPFSMDTTMTAHLLAPGDTTEIAVCVTPMFANPDSAAVTIVSDAWNSPMTVTVRIDAATAVEPDRTPKPFRIVSVAPNPFNPTTSIHFTLPAPMPVTAEVYSVAGARLRVLAEGMPFEQGDNEIVWDGRTDRGMMVASGLYFIRLETQVGAKVARAVLLK